MLAKVAAGDSLSEKETKIFEDHPRIGSQLITKIPRLGGVARIIACQQKRFDDAGTPEERSAGPIPFGARVLKLAIDVVQLRLAEKNGEEIWSIISAREGCYDPALFDALVEVLDVEYVVRSVTIKQLEDDMILDEHVVTPKGDVLLARGQPVTESLRERLAVFASSERGVREPIRVRRPLDRSKSGAPAEADKAPVTA